MARRPRLFLALLLLVVWLPLAPAAAPPPDFVRLAREHGPAVVNIAASYAPPFVLPDIPQDDALAEFLDRLSWQLVPDSERAALGSGFLIRADGYILTAFHVVEEAYNDEVVVRLADGREFLGRVAGIDPESDLALVRIDARGLPTVRIGDPKKLQAGEWVLTIGSPFGFERSVAAGIVSAPARNVPASRHLGLIQTDVAMNPGHSGGPLFNLAGEVVGVNSLIFSNTGASIGVSFAIPIDAAMAIADELRLHGAVRRGRLGVRLQELTPELARALRLAAPAGALITEVEKDAPAARAGLRAGDVVVRFGGKPVATHAELLKLAAATAPGSAVPVEALRYGTPVRATVQVSAYEHTPPRLADKGGTDRLGFILAPLSEPQRRRLGLEGGLLVQRAEGAARRAGLVAGDVIVAVNGHDTRSTEAFRAAVEKVPAGEALALHVARGGSRAFIALRMP
ncbi:MAG TPA: trypsin-like peptidase domain-containing protein [Burkholderiales bacterium]|nr:trypsin-like peptidase domain-containing protein [Burkholderiales bacterium]